MGGIILAVEGIVQVSGDGLGRVKAGDDAFRQPKPAPAAGRNWWRSAAPAG
jgi:hypothetical protein